MPKSTNNGKKYDFMEKSITLDIMKLILDKWMRSFVKLVEDHVGFVVHSSLLAGLLNITIVIEPPFLMLVHAISIIVTAS